MKLIEVNENGIFARWEIDSEGHLKLWHFSAKPFHETDLHYDIPGEGFAALEMNLAGYNRPGEHQGHKYIMSYPGAGMVCRGVKDEKNEIGRRLAFDLWDEDTKMQVDYAVQFYDGIPVARFQNTVTNCGSETQTLEYVSTFHYGGMEKEGLRPRDEKMSLRIPYNSWQRELNWKTYTLPQLGLDQVQRDPVQHSSSAIRVFNTGNWSAKEYLPMGYAENQEAKTGLYWQIEHNGSWYWELSEQNGHLYLAVSGPNEVFSHWTKDLKPGQSFTTVPAAVGVSKEEGGVDAFENGMAALTEYRRRIRRPNRDNEVLPVIFNDYMNCLWGQPTADLEYPMIDAAKEAGCEYFVIDCGWYADGAWWDNVGEWQESRQRFPEGVKAVMDYIRSKGMVPGLWIEPEVMGINCELANKVPDEWFFMRHGKRVYDRSRYQLDYRNPEVRKHMDEVMDRLVKDYGAGYFKFDYNIEPGVGTEVDSDSVGDGLLEHERAYLSWLDGLWKRYPDLVIENCSSGGLRMEYAMLSRCSIQSTSDTDDYLMYPVIAVNAPAGLTPEQAAVWSYPLSYEDNAPAEDVLKEQTVFNMVNAILLRIHQSGHLAKLDAGRKALVTEGIGVYKEVRGDIAKAVPFWPIGLAQYDDEWVALGLKAEKTAYIAVWHRKEGSATIDLSVSGWKGCGASAERIYPSFADEPFTWDDESGVLSVKLDKAPAARLFRIRIE